MFFIEQSSAGRKERSSQGKSSTEKGQKTYLMASHRKKRGQVVASNLESDEVDPEFQVSTLCACGCTCIGICGWVGIDKTIVSCHHRCAGHFMPPHYHCQALQVPGLALGDLNGIIRLN